MKIRELFNEDGSLSKTGNIYFENFCQRLERTIEKIEFNNSFDVEILQDFLVRVMKSRLEKEKKKF